ncbi:MAG: hypothetical protein IJW14_01820 [Oscillospiraceae bacterium]|nr:hypothetical protein [Oscillospiraceae bacterium]
MKKKNSNPVKTIYYTDERNDEFADDNIVAKKIDESYVYVDDRLRWKVLRFISYRLIAMPIAFLYCKIALHSRFRNRAVLKQAKGKGCFVYGNHTQQIGDPFIPNLALFPKSVYVIVHLNNVSMPVLGRITPHLGAPIWPDQSLPKSVAKEKLKQQTEAFCNAVYEKEYGARPVYRRIG